MPGIGSLIREIDVKIDRNIGKHRKTLPHFIHGINAGLNQTCLQNILRFIFFCTWKVFSRKNRHIQ